MTAQAGRGKDGSHQLRAVREGVRMRELLTYAHQLMPDLYLIQVEKYR